MRNAPEAPGNEILSDHPFYRLFLSAPLCGICRFADAGSDVIRFASRRGKKRRIKMKIKIRKRSKSKRIE
jgi:hypothetical protein